MRFFAGLSALVIAAFAPAGFAQDGAVKADSAKVGSSGPVHAAHADSAGVDSADAAQSDELDESAESGERVAAPSPQIPPMQLLGKPGRLDGIAAVVGSEIILHSELETYVYMRLQAMGAGAGSVDIKALLRESLEELIDNKVLLVRAMEDSAIVVRNDEVESMLNNHINNIMRQNNLNAGQFERALMAQQGTTLARFKTEMRRAIREQLHKQKLQQRFYFSTNVNRRDVERFFAQYRDSLPDIGESFELYKLSLRLSASDSVRQAAFDKIRAVKQQLDAGAAFAEMAKLHSESPEGAEGGDLGYLEKGSTSELVFEERAFSLPVGRVSEPFETRLGYHILLVEEKRDRRVKLSQILVKHAPAGQQRDELLERLDSLSRALSTRQEFEAAARAMSADNATRTRGGALGWLSLFEIAPEVRNAVMSLNAGQVSQTVAEDNMLSIYMVADRVDSRRLSLENDYPAIAEKARDIAAQKQLLDNVKKWRESIFIDVRI
ncbi:MAG: peptidylprolyl isomerase [Chitinispirillia bacterium]|nr:peptidylprolyl isomerase [Chitinispirillia bacterium]MCL2241167.1 peptidylprolyl isomerase [Chitinispirillia bacterium]